MEARSEDVDVVFVARIHADLAVVHRPRVERVDAVPRGACVLGLEHTAILESVGTLLVLRVAALTAESDAERAFTAATVDVRAVLFVHSMLVERDLKLHELAVADDLELGSVAREEVAQRAAQLGLVQDRRVGDAQDDVAFLQLGLGSGGVFLRRVHEGAQLGAAHGDAEPCGVVGLLRDLLGLNDREEMVWLGRGPGHADASEDARGQAGGRLVPGLASVARDEDARTVAPLDGGVVGIEHVAAALVRRDRDGVRIGRVHLDLDDARVLIDVVDAFPGVAAVDGLVETAFLIRPPESTQRTGVDRVGVLRVHHDCADLEGLGQASVAPGGAAVAGDVDAVTP